MRPELFFASETRTVNDICEGETQIINYTCIRSDSSSRNSGGVCIYVRNDIKVQEVYEYRYEYNNFLIVDVTNGTCRGRWLCVYHSPNQPHYEFIDKLEEICNTYNSSGACFNCIGDFNINCHSSTASAYKSRLLRSMTSQGLKQIITGYTRVTIATKTTIDLLFTNNPKATADIVDIEQIADHRIIVVNKKVTNRAKIEKEVINRSAYNKSELISIFKSNFNYNIFNQLSVDEKCNYYESLLTAAMATMVNKKKVTIGYSQKWYNEELHEIRLQRNMAQKIAETTNSSEKWHEYRIIRNKYNNMLHKASNNFIRNTIANCGKDIKKIWRELKKFEKCTSAVPENLMLDGIKYNDPILIPDLFNEYFVNSVAELHASIPPVTYDETQFAPNQNIRQPWNEFQLITEEKLHEIQKKIRTKSGIDNINIDVLKDFNEKCAELTTALINESLKAGIFPEEWKTSMVTPIQKVKRTIDIKEHRAINNIKATDKICEIFVKEQLEEHFKENNCIAVNQSAFRKAHSCETSVNLILNEFKCEMEKGNAIAVLSLDLKRAFELVDRKILAKKLKNSGIGGSVAKWFDSWMNNRKQYTVYNGRKSKTIEIGNGIAQGTPLSCLLFLIYFNDISKIFEKCSINLFADDTLIWYSASTIEEAVLVMNEEMQKLDAFLKMHKLKLNAQKTKWMAINKKTRTSNLHVTIDGCDIEEVQSIKYLGVIVDNKLSFKENFDVLFKKMTKKVNYMGRMRNKLSSDTKLMLYKAIVLPNIDYCSSVLFLLSDGELMKLQKIQNKALRIALNKNIYTRTKKLHEIAKIKTIKQKIYNNVLILMYKVKNNSVPVYLCKNLKTVGESQPYELRTNKTYKIPNFKTTQAQNSLFYKGTKLLNDYLNECTEQQTFKQEIVQISQYITRTV